MLQIKSFGTKGDCCQATQPERGYRSNQSDLKPDLRNGVAIVVRWRKSTDKHAPPPLPLSVYCFQGPFAKHKQTEGFSGKMQNTTEMSSCGTNNKQGFQSRGVLKLRGDEVRQLMDDISQNQQHINCPMSKMSL